MVWTASTTTSAGPSPPSVQSCMLISDMARKTLRDRSEISANARVRVGHSMSGKTRGTVFVRTMPTRRQMTNNGSLIAGLRHRLLQRVADQDHDIQDQQRAQKADMVQVVDGLVFVVVGQADDRVGR